ncbi:pseudouridine synthase [Leptolyngbya sp. BL0902]|uniref:pseudouridine synthase n=1 Tax=Leptolyngbya sp. BL0902 TaxID=1115757 RepID=UPI0018E7F176|nr:pseudouridine synthase [Leptolyngbya sp. BL0902]
MAERLQKLLAQHGLASRRKAEEWIIAGRVTVNGVPAHLGQKVDPDHDQVAVDQRLLTLQQRPQPYYLLLHKPLGMVSTCADPQGRPTVLDALPPELWCLGLHPVGRLDTYSSGALILTNDGDFTYRLTHPKHGLAKHYRVRVAGRVSPDTLATWQQGIELDGRLTCPAQVKIVGVPGSRHTDLAITLWEGRNRQIRRVAEVLGHRVLRLHRLAIGSVRLGNLQGGAYRSLSTGEIKALLAESDVSPTLPRPSPQVLAGTSPF